MSVKNLSLQDVSTENPTTENLTIDNAVTPFSYPNIDNSINTSPWVTTTSNPSGYFGTTSRAYSSNSTPNNLEHSNLPEIKIFSIRESLKEDIQMCEKIFAHFYKIEDGVVYFYVNTDKVKRKIINNKVIVSQTELVGMYPDKKYIIVTV